MFTMLGGDGKEYGPVTVDQLRSWLTEGRANLDTKIKRLNEPTWIRVGDLPEFGGPASFVPPPVLSTGDVVSTLPQAPYSEPTDPSLLAEELIRRAQKIDVFGCFEDGWELFKKNLWPFVGASALFLVISYFLQSIKGTRGMILNIVLTGPLMGGYFYFFLCRARGQRAGFETLIVGFQKALLPLVLATLVTTIFTTLGLICLLLPGIYLLVAYSFTQLLVVDKRLDFWPAMELSRRVITAQWWRIFALLCIGAIVTVLGAIGLLVGVFFTFPIAVAAAICAYEKLCAPKGPASHLPSL